MQGIQVWSLVWKDSTCLGATKPLCLNDRAWALEPTNHSFWACVQLLKPALLEPVLLSRRSHHNEKPVHRNWRKPWCSNKDPVQPQVIIMIIKTLAPPWPLLISSDVKLCSSHRKRKDICSCLGEAAPPRSAATCAREGLRSSPPSWPTLATSLCWHWATKETFCLHWQLDTRSWLADSTEN